jgi:predicted transposase YdaD
MSVRESRGQRSRIEKSPFGRIEGKVEGKLEIARNMLAEGLTLPLIIKMTGLTEADITRLQLELKDKNHLSAACPSP